MPIEADDCTYDEMLETWSEEGCAQPNQAETFRRFVDWTVLTGIKSPGGRDVAKFLLEMLAAGAALEMIERAADAIHRGYVEHRLYLDLLPVEAALEIAAAQLSTRTLH